MQLSGFGAGVKSSSNQNTLPTPTVVVREYYIRAGQLCRGRDRKIGNHMAAVAINYLAYNFIKIHRTLRVSPAMAAGVTTRLFEVSDLVALLVESESEKAA